MRRVLAGVVAAAIALSAVPGFAQEKLTVWWVKGFYKSEDDALYEAIKKFEAEDRRQGRPVAVCGAGHDRRRRWPRSTPARRRTCLFRYIRLPDCRQVGLRRQARGHLGHHRADERPLRAGHHRDHLPLQRQDQEEGLLRLPDEAADHAHPVLEGHAGAGRASRRATFPKTWKEYWSFWCDKVQPANRKRHGPARLRHRPADGRRLDRLLLLVPDLRRCLQRQAGRRRWQAPGRRSQGEAGPGRGAADYAAPYTKGCTPPSSTSWKDPDNNVAFHNKTTVMTHNATISIAAKWLDDANNEALTPEERAAGRKNYDELIATSGFPKKPDGTTDDLPRGGQDRRDLRRGQEQGAGEGVRGLPVRGREPASLRRGLAGPLVPGDQGQQESPFWQADRIARPSTTSSRPARCRSSSPRTTSSPSSTTRTCGPRR
jgi:multiple sugar transport system substrate-binding protein